MFTLQAEVTQRLSNAKEAANKPVLQSHEDLARKIQVAYSLQLVFYASDPFLRVTKLKI